METDTTVLDTQKKYGSRALVLAIGAGLLFLSLGQKEVCRGLVLGGVFSAVNFALMGPAIYAFSNVALCAAGDTPRFGCAV